MVLYSAEMKHSAETVKKFTLLQYNTFEWWRKGLLLLLSAALVLFGISVHSPIPMILCLFAGCFFFSRISPTALRNPVFQMGKTGRPFPTKTSIG